MLKKILVVSCVVAGLAPVQAHAISISDSFDFGLETDGPCFPNVATVDGIDIDVLVTSAGSAVPGGFGPFLGFDADSNQKIQFLTGNDDDNCLGSPISVSVCLVDQRPNPSAINKFLRTLGQTHQWNPWELADVTFMSTVDGTFTSIDGGTSVSFSGQSLDLIISSGPWSLVYLYLGPCSPPTISFDEIDLSHYLNRVPVEEAVSLPDTGSSSILSGLFVSMAFVIFGFTLTVVSRRTRQSGSA